MGALLLRSPQEGTYVRHEIARKYSFDAQRVWNLDETGVSSGRDAKGKVRQPQFQRRGETNDAELASFTYTSRVIILPCISAASDPGPALFIFKGMNIAYQQARRS